MRFILYAAITIPFQYIIMSRLPYTGDEPHYLMTVISLLKDHDLNLYNNYSEKDFNYIGYSDLTPQIAIRDSFIPPEHGFGFPLLMVAPFWLLGIGGTRLVLVVLSYITLLLIAAICERMTNKARVGTLAGFILAASPTWQVHASRFFPENVAGLLFCLVILLMLHLMNEHRQHWLVFTLGVLVAFCPVLYLKYTVIGMALFMASLFIRNIRTNMAYYAGVLVVAGCGLYVWLNTYGLSIAGAGGSPTHDFVLTGMFDRFWQPWFDRQHGLLTLQPVYLLSFWAIPHHIFTRHADSRSLLLWVSLAVGAYAVMYGLFLGSPGASMPGRYLCAALPLLSMLLSTWVFERGPQNWVRRYGVYLLLLPGIAFIGGSVLTSRVPWELLPQFYKALFFPYWSSGPTVAPSDARYISFLLIGLVVLTKALTVWRSKARSQNCSLAKSVAPAGWRGRP
jgi:hypothetical protein